MKLYSKALEHILKARLLKINRWNDVNVHHPGDAWPHDVTEVYDDDNQHVIIHWHGQKSKKNTHPYEIQQVPINHLKKMIKLQADKLAKDNEDYK